MELKLLLTSALFSMGLTAGELVNSATVVEVANTNYNSKDFAIFLEGGTGVCATSGRYSIVFPEHKFLTTQSQESYNQAFSIALSAMATGGKVRIHNFEGNECDKANFIAVSK